MITRFDEQCKARWGLVTPLKKNNLNRAEILDFKKSTWGRWWVGDMVVWLHTGKHELRTVVLKEEGGDADFRLLTNLWEVDAETIKRLYEARWQIVTLFRAVKQEFRLKTNRPSGDPTGPTPIQWHA